MAKLSCVLLLIAAISAANCNSANRIAGGSSTNIEKYPGIVQVESRIAIGAIWSQSCAANVLTTRHLLSVGHCFEGILFSIRNRRIRAGTSLRDRDGVIVYIDRFLTHPSFGAGEGLDGDVSLLYLSSALVFSDQIRPVSIPIQGYQIPDNVAAVQLGWGATSEGGQASPVLNEVQVNTINRTVCADRYASVILPQPVTENMICTGIGNAGVICQGDSGSPLYYNGVLVGMASWTRGCNRPDNPGVNAAVSSYTDWIVANTASI